MKFKLPKLDYEYYALEPFIDRRTMEIHHQKHHGAYVDKLNAACNEDLPIDDLMRNIGDYSPAVRNNGGGHFNHSLFWKILSPDRYRPSESLSAAINKKFGDIEGLKNSFTQEALNRFGSGWAWLCLDNSKSLLVCSTPNQDNPLMYSTNSTYTNYGIRCMGTCILFDLPE